MDVEKRKIKVAILGVGNCASSFVQGIYHYSDNDSEDGLISDVIGGYKVSDIEVVAAYDINASKVGKDLSKAPIAFWLGIPPSRLHASLEGLVCRACHFEHNALAGRLLFVP